MRLTLRITIALTIIAACSIGIYFLLGSTGLARGVFFPAILFAGIFIGSTFLLLTLWVELPLKAMLHHLAGGDVEALKKSANVKNDFGWLAELLVRTTSDKPVSKTGRQPATSTSLAIDAVYCDLVETAPDAIMLLDNKGSIIFGNQQAGILCGHATGIELSGKSFYGFVAPENRQDVETAITALSGTKRTDTFELNITKHDSSVFPAEATITGIAGSLQGAGACSLFLRDSTSRKKAEEKKQALEQQLRAVYKMEALGQLANGIAHDLNNSLGAISGYIELIKKMGMGDEERLRKYADTIAAATQRSARLIHHLLTFARKGRMQITSFDVNEIIADTVKLLESTIDKSVSLVLDLKAADATITGDPGQLQNAVVNLAMNARDAMPGGGTLTFRTGNVFIDEPFAKQHSYKMTHGYYLAIAVSDTGVGMDLKIRDHLFEPFYSTKGTTSGSGLGLAAVYGSVKSHHGYIEADSAPERGSTFTIYLPITQAQRPDEAGDAQALLPAPPRRRIMVVDDELPLREMLAELLTWLGFSVTVFGDPREALDFYAAHHTDVDLTILDWKMPAIDGMECFRTIRGINPAARVLIATGYCLDSKREEFLDQGVAGIIPKPFVSADLTRAIAEALA